MPARPAALPSPLVPSAPGRQGTAEEKCAQVKFETAGLCCAVLKRPLPGLRLVGLGRDLGAWEFVIVTALLGFSTLNTSVCAIS